MLLIVLATLVLVCVALVGALPIGLVGLIFDLLLPSWLVVLHVCCLFG